MVKDCTKENKVSLPYRIPEREQRRISDKVLIDNTHIPAEVQRLLESQFPDLKDNPRVTELLARIHNSYYPSHNGFGAG